MSLHERIAAALGWTVAEAQSFGLHTLRDIVRPVDAALAGDITAAIDELRTTVGLNRKWRRKL